MAASTLGCQHDPTAADGGVRERWYQVQPGWSWSRPAVLGNTVYFGTGDGQVIARDVATGRMRWSAKVGTQQVQGANLLARSGVVVAPVVLHTAGVDALTGAILWRYEAPRDTVGVSPGSPGYVGGTHIDADDATVYIPAWGASVSAVDLRTGTARWVWQPGRMDGDTAASGVFRSGAQGTRVSGDTVFATLWHYVTRLGVPAEAWVVALDRPTGRELWRVRLPHQGSGVFVNSALVTYRNLLIFQTLPTRTYAIDRATQQVMWEFTVSGRLLSNRSGPELYGDTVYVDGGDEHIYALRAGDGGVIWRAPFPAQATTDLLATNRRIVFTNGDKVFVLDRLTGAQVAAVTQPRTHDPLIASAAAFANGLVFVTVAEGAWCFEEP